MIDTVQKDETEELNETITVLFPGLDMTTTQKVQTWKVHSYPDFLKVTIMNSGTHSRLKSAKMHPAAHCQLCQVT